MWGEQSEEQEAHADSYSLTPWEKKCLDEWDKDGVQEDRAQAEEMSRLEKKLWASFQHSAAAISQLYKEGGQQENLRLWIPFQSAAGAATILYKDSQDMLRRSFELGSAHGSRRRTKELLAWARSRLPPQSRRTGGGRPAPTREELVAWACGRPGPPTPPPGGHARPPRGAVGGRGAREGAGGGSRGAEGLGRTTPPRFARAGGGCCAESPDFLIFKDALAFQGPNGVMSSNRRPPSHPSPARQSPLRVGGANGVTGVNFAPSQPTDDLRSFLAEQAQRYARKRAGSSEPTGGGPWGGAESDSPGRGGAGGGYKKCRMMETDDF